MEQGDESRHYTQWCPVFTEGRTTLWIFAQAQSYLQAADARHQWVGVSEQSGGPAGGWQSFQRPWNQAGDRTNGLGG